MRISIRFSVKFMFENLFWNEIRGTLASVEGGDDVERSRLSSALAMRCDTVVFFPHDAQALGKRQKKEGAGRAIVLDMEAAFPERMRRHPPVNTLLLSSMHGPALPSPTLVVAMGVPPGYIRVTDPASGESWKLSLRAPLDEPADHVETRALSAAFDAWSIQVGSPFRATP